MDPLKMAKKRRNIEKQDLDNRNPQQKKEHRKAPERRIQMSFEVSADFKRAYKLYGVEQGMSMLEIFQESFELYKKIYPIKN